MQGAVLRECVVNLARIKEYVAQNVSGTLDAAGFDNWPELMRGIKAGLLMLGKSRAVEIIEEITQHLKRVMQPGGIAWRRDYLDRLADAIVSLEYYIETLQAGRSDPWYMLDNARSLPRCAGARARARAADGRPRPAAGTYAKTLLHRPAAGRRRRTPTDMRRHRAPSTRAAGAGRGRRRASHADEHVPDPELIRLFVEEAQRGAGQDPAAVLRSGTTIRSRAMRC